MQALHYSLSGRLSVTLADLDATQLAAAQREFDPFAPTAAAADADVLVQGLIEVPGAAERQGPAQDGTSTLIAGERLFLLDGELACEVPDALIGGCRVALAPGFGVARAWARVVRPVMHLRLHDHNAVAVHAAAVEQDGEAVVVAGWSESGKTEVALALMERGARFVSDKWTVVAADGVSAFPIGVGVRRWVLPYLPTLRASLPRAARAQLRASGAAGRTTDAVRPALGRSRGGALVAGALDTAVRLGDRAGLSPSALRGAYGQSGDDPARRVALGTVVVLMTTPEDRVTVSELDAAGAARRLARSAMYERRGYFELLERAAAVLPAREGGRQELAAQREEALLAELLAGARRIVGVSAPFPADPGRVADAIARGA